MKRLMLLCLLVLLLVPAVGPAAEKKNQPFTQKDCAMMLIKQFAWDTGLPKDPIDRDLLVILGGKRTFRYEAENAYNAAADNVSVSEFEIYGPFSGKGWLMGVATHTRANFTILLPVAGEYAIKSALRGDGFVWEVAGKKLTTGANDNKEKKMREVEIGTVMLPAGVVQITVTIPPDGGIDYFTLAGADYAPVGPFDGWRFKNPLTAAALAEILVSATGQMNTLPVEQNAVPMVFPVTSMVNLPESTSLIDTSYLGSFISKQWLRANYRGAQLQVPFTVDKLGLYEVSAQILSETVTGDLNGTSFRIPGKPYLDRVVLGQFRLDPGASTLNLALPPMGGFDALYLQRRDSSPAAFMKLAGISGKPDRLISAVEAEGFIKKLAPRAFSRK